ncbi:hypothetical protein NDU88_004141 [Pleurodeles waltl]|uniref:Uncharacterized protein n=1 Tax=Pleurodeles waltl TaxID=8319 RepID=A0AAV7V239_PLEWA|nr:hypothetical protein NDU88_004141 [Pleurodeles waltl]
MDQSVPPYNYGQITAPFSIISATPSDSLTASSTSENIPAQLNDSLTSLGDETSADSKDESESPEGSDSSPLREQIKSKEEESSDVDSNSCTVRKQNMNLLEIKGKLCTSVEDFQSSGNSSTYPVVNKPADSAFQMTHTAELSRDEDTPGLPSDIMEPSDNEKTVPLSSELMDFYDNEETPAVTKNVMDFSESQKVPPVSEQMMEVSNDEERQQSKTEQHAIRNDSLLLELDTVAVSTTDPNLLFTSIVLPVSSSKVSEDQLLDLPVSDPDFKLATPMPPAVYHEIKSSINLKQKY